LQDNLSSAINIVIAGDDTSYSRKTYSLFNGEQDSVITSRVFWGAFDIGTAEAFIQRDTLYKGFSLAYAIDSNKWAALYLQNNQRPVAVSGKTAIKGDAFLPPAGINQAYVDNVAYTGDKRLVTGHIKNSAANLPALDSIRLAKFKALMKQDHGDISIPPKSDSLQNSFLSPVIMVNFKKQEETLSNVKLNGNIILFSDTTLTIDSTAILNNVMVFAKSITVKSGFRGKCQLFATDTIGIGPRCRFDYPSCLGVIRYKPGTIITTIPRINLQNNSIFNGLIFSYQEDRKTAVVPLINIGTDVIVKGLIYSQGFLQFNKGAEVDGLVMTSGFLYQTTYTRYENYIVNTTLDEQALSPYYLNSSLVPVITQQKKILQWLERN